MFDQQRLPRQELIDFCQRLIQTPSVNGADPERAVVDLIVEFASRFGLSAEKSARDPARPNALVRIGPRRHADMLLVAHTDTVPPGRTEEWSAPPFSGEIRDGRMYGRGACDNKGGLVAALAAMLLAQQLPATQRPTILLACVPDEESGATGRLGVLHLHANGKLSGRGAIYTYPGMHEIIVGHRGLLRITLRTHGTAMHSGSLDWQNAPRGHNALTGMAEILLELEQRVFSPPNDELFAPLRTVITPTIIKGGSGPSIVPDYCEALLDIRMVPSTNNAEIEQAIRETLKEVEQRRPPLRTEMRIDVALPPTEIAPDSPIVLAVQQAAHQITGHRPPLAVSGPANESYLLNGLGIPTCIFGPIGEKAHAANEHVVIDTIFQAAEVYARAAIELAKSHHNH